MSKPASFWWSALLRSRLSAKMGKPLVLIWNKHAQANEQVIRGEYVLGLFKSDEYTSTDFSINRRTFLGGATVATLGLLAGSPTFAFADTAAEKQAEADAALASLNSMQEKLDKATANYDDALAEQKAAQKRMDEAEKKINEATARISELQDNLSSRARSMYRTGSSTFLDFLLGAASFNEFSQNWFLLGKINENDEEMVQETKDLRAEVEVEKKVYTEQEKVAAKKAEEAKKIKDEAENTVAAMQDVYNSLSAEAAALLEEERAAQEAAQAQEAQDAHNNGTLGGGSGSHAGKEPPYSAVTGNAIVDRAYSYLGNANYVFGACSPGKFDCSGFVSYCLTGSYSRLGSTTTFMNWPRVSNPKPGDVCTNWTHCGIYIGGGMMIHCSSPQVGVIESGVYSNMIFVRY